MELTLVVLAAGLGSRYGGLKQVDGVGPSGEFLMDYAVFDAIRAGFHHLVFVTRPDIEDSLRGRYERAPGLASLQTVRQDLNDLPPGVTPPVGRQKPWGTTHAVLVTEPAVRTPFAVINADDFYGAEAYRLLRNHFEARLEAGASGTVADTAMVAYTLGDTLSPLGNVARGVCEAGADGMIRRVVEVKKIVERDGLITGIDDGGATWRLTGDEPTSMNFWGFTPAVFPLMRQAFARFITERSTDLAAEAYISNTMDGLIAAGQATLRMYRTTERSIGMTNRGDREEVVAHIRKLVDLGVYPARLFP